MWSAGIVTIIWIAGMALSKMKDSKDATDPQKENSPSIQLEALKAIRESAYQRWERRRNYEWQLSLSIWTALAAFSAIVITKDFQIANRYATGAIVAVIGVAISWLHHRYVLRMFEHTIADVHIQRWAEKEMYKLAFDMNMPNSEEGFPDYKLYPALSKYGRIQAVITLMLALAAMGAVLAPRISQLSANQSLSPCGLPNR